MLTKLYIKNYALIDELSISFSNGFSIITGETGAGKSILLGGLGLVLGNRADLSQIKNSDQKCVIEAVFDITNYNLDKWFKQLDLDYDVTTIIRREISPSGKSRAFINDTPVVLEVLSELGSHLIDIHSQHQTQQITQDIYQFEVIDALADNKGLIEEYTNCFSAYKVQKKALEQLQLTKAEHIKEYDYNSFLWNELNALPLDTLNIDDLELEYDALQHVEEIKEQLTNSEFLLNQENLGVVDQLRQVKQELSKIVGCGKPYETLSQRIESVSIEIDDIISEMSTLKEVVVSDPEQLHKISEQLDLVRNLLQKHAVTSVKELVAIKNTLETKVNTTHNIDDAILEAEQKLHKLHKDTMRVAGIMSQNRKVAIPILKEKLEAILLDLGMSNARFKIELDSSDIFLTNGMDKISFLFMANKGSNYNTLKKSASGGELSRIMLSLKYILSEYKQLPSIMFDEIDTGVSGDISNKMGAIMAKMSKHMQVFSITHLPQIAARGDVHYKVYKTVNNHSTTTQVKRLSENDRVVEIAKMLGGNEVTESAITHAKQLLN